jgi:plasmid maintenance system antidote protein VapI
MSKLSITLEADMPKRFAIHSGDILLTEFMEPLELTAYRLAK